MKQELNIMAIFSKHNTQIWNIVSKSKQ